MSQSRIDRSRSKTSNKTPLLIGLALLVAALVGGAIWYTQSTTPDDTTDVVVVPFDPTFLGNADLLELEEQIIDRVDFEREYSYNDSLPTLVRDVISDLEAYRETLILPELDDEEAEAFRRRALDTTANTIVFYNDLHDHLLTARYKKSSFNPADPANMDARTRLLADSVNIIQAD